MEKIRRTKIVDLLKCRDFGTMVNVKGWVRTRRGSKQVSFIALNDGSTINNVQVVVDIVNFNEEVLKQITTGACVSVNGVLVESVGAGQAAEVQSWFAYNFLLESKTYILVRRAFHLREPCDVGICISQ